MNLHNLLYYNELLKLDEFVDKEPMTSILGNCCLSNILYSFM